MIVLILFLNPQPIAMLNPQTYRYRVRTPMCFCTPCFNRRSYNPSPPQPKHESKLASDTTSLFHRNVAKMPSFPITPPQHLQRHRQQTRPRRHMQQHAQNKQHNHWRPKQRVSRGEGGAARPPCCRHRRNCAPVPADGSGAGGVQQS